MTQFVDKLKLKEKAEEDLYFARRDAALTAVRRRESHLEARAVDGPLRVVSGGQTGVDRAALNAALRLGLPLGGWCPSGRRAEDGAVPDRYPMQETPTSDYAERTEWNVRDSDATLILYRGAMTGGTGLTAQIARRLGKPLVRRNLLEPVEVEPLADWLVTNRIHVLNCAGPGESGAPGIGEEATRIFIRLFRAWSNGLDSQGQPFCAPGVEP